MQTNLTITGAVQALSPPRAVSMAEVTHVRVTLTLTLEVVEVGEAWPGVEDSGAESIRGLQS